MQNRCIAEIQHLVLAEITTVVCVISVEASIMASTWGRNQSNLTAPFLVILPIGVFIILLMHIPKDDTTQHTRITVKEVSSHPLLNNSSYYEKSTPPAHHLEETKADLVQSEDYVTASVQEAQTFTNKFFNVKSDLQKIEAMAEDQKGYKPRLPSVIHIGERKTGTTTLMHFLRSHPQVRSPRKEPHFFDFGRNYQEGLVWYVNLMPPTTQDEITFEKTASYFRNPYVPQRIAEALPNVKLILSVRHPIIRAISDFHFTQSAPWPCNYDRSKFETFDEYVLDSVDSGVNASFPPIARSLYVNSIQEWLQYFNLSQFYIFDGDSLRTSNPALELKQLEKFMGLTPFFKPGMFFFDSKGKHWCLRDPGCISFGGNAHPPIKETTYGKLMTFFKPYNQEFYDMVHKNFKW